MAKKGLPGAGLNDQQQAALVQIGKMMGPHATGFDQRVQALHDEAHADEHASTDYEKEFGDFPHEAGAEKMKAAQTGSASVPLGPTQIQQQTVKGQEAGLQQANSQGQLQAAKAQAQQVPPSPPSTPPLAGLPPSAQAGAPPPPPAPDETQPPDGSQEGPQQD